MEIPPHPYQASRAEEKLAAGLARNYARYPLPAARCLNASVERYVQRTTTYFWPGKLQQRALQDSAAL
jgi:hypothetical protein